MTAPTTPRITMSDQHLGQQIIQYARAIKFAPDSLPAAEYDRLCDRYDELCAEQDARLERSER